MNIFLFINPSYLIKVGTFIKDLIVDHKQERESASVFKKLQSTTNNQAEFDLTFIINNYHNIIPLA